MSSERKGKSLTVILPI